MSGLPSHWQMVTLNDLQADEPRAITDGPFGSHLTSAHYTDSGPRVVRLQNIGDGVFHDARAHISEQHFQSLRAHEVLPGDLLVASLGETLPRACLAPPTLGPAIVKADCIRIRLASNVDARWVMYSLQRPEVRKWAEEHRHGVGRPRLGLKVIRQIPVPLPPFREQRCIVDILEDHISRLDAADRGIRDGLDRLLRLSDCVIKFHLLGGTDKAGRVASNVRPEGVDDGRLRDLPEGWYWRRLGDLAEVVGGITKDSKRQADPELVDVPYLRVANVQRGRLDLRNIATIRVTPDKAATLWLQSGDVLLNEGGDRDKLARGWVWEGQIEGCIHQNHVFRARIRNDLLEPRLLSWAANTLGAPWAERNGKQSVNLASISLSKIRLMPIPVPPRTVQLQLVQSISEQLEAIDRLASGLRSAGKRSVMLRRALMAAAFSGRLTGQASDMDLVEEMAGV